MSDRDRFAAFSFVDKIHSVDVGKSITAEYQIPDSLPDFSRAFCCEAVGQCACWAAMAAVDFQYQPVAGITTRIDFFETAKPGQILQLSAELSRADEEAVKYNGSGSIDGKEVVKLTGCLGPMLPMEDFDDPQRMKARYETLCSSEGAETGKFPGGIPDFDVDSTERDGDIIKASFKVPESAAFLNDHFPRKPVFPGTLLMTLCIQLARRFVSSEAIPIGIYLAKIREFMEPGALLEFTAEQGPDDDEGNRFVVISLVTNGRAKRLVKVGFREPGS